MPRTAADLLALSASRADRIDHIGNIFAILRNGLDREKMDAFLAGMAEDRRQFQREAEEVIRPMVEGGLAEAGILTIIDRITDLAAHDTLFALMSYAAILDADPATIPAG